MHTLIAETPAIAQAFHDADEYWQAALDIEFGRDAGQARYEERGQGEPGSVLRTVADRRHAAYQRWAAAAFGVEG